MISYYYEKAHQDSSMFGRTTQFQVPQLFLAKYAAWDEYMSQVWSKVLENMEPKMCVIEIAPGTSTKIGLALNLLNFKGTLYVVEPSKKILSVVCNRYKKLLPKSHIVPVMRTLNGSLPKITQRPDFLIANHPLDDMIMYNSEKKSLFDWCLNPSNCVSDDFKKHWDYIRSNKYHQDIIKQSIISQWINMIMKLKPSSTVISQYPSDAYEKHGLHALNDFACQILETLKINLSSPKIIVKNIQSTLNQFENYNSQYIGNGVLNAKNWLYCEQIRDKNESNCQDS